jgi:ankyrin repeat protein
MAQEMIKWVMFANSPLRGPELEQAVQISIEGDDFDDDDIVPIHRLLEFACGFLVQTLSGYVRFVHFTADEFLAGIVLEWFPAGLTKTTNDCLQFLSRKNFERSWSSGDFSSLLSLMARYPLHRHCAQNWSFYLDRAGDEASNVLALKFLKNGALVKTAGLSSTMDGPEFPALLASKGLSGLHMAIHSRVELLSLQLIGSNVCTNLDLQDYMGRTPLWLAADYGQLRVVCALLDAGASSDIANHAGWTPLLVAITKHQDEVVGALISDPWRPADVNINGSGNGFLDRDLSPVMVAVLARNSYALRLLLDRPDVRIDVEVGGATALSCAAHEGDANAAKMLLSTGKCDVNQTVEGESRLSPLHIAAIEGHADMCRLLIGHGADVDLVDHEGNPPLMRAILHGHYEVVCSLLRSGASLKTRDKKGRTGLHHAARAENTEVLNLLLTHDEVLSSINTVDSVGNTALYIALRYGCPDHGAVLVTFGADVDAVNENGQTSHEFAKQKGIELFPESDYAAQDHNVVWITDVLPSRPRATGQKGSAIQLERAILEQENQKRVL